MQILFTAHAKRCTLQGTAGARRRTGHDECGAERQLLVLVEEVVRVLEGAHPLASVMRAGALEACPQYAMVYTSQLSSMLCMHGHTAWQPSTMQAPHTRNKPATRTGHHGRQDAHLVQHHAADRLQREQVLRPDLGHIQRVKVKLVLVARLHSLHAAQSMRVTE